MSFSGIGSWLRYNREENKECKIDLSKNASQATPTKGAYSSIGNDWYLMEDPYGPAIVKKFPDRDIPFHSIIENYSGKA